MTSSRHPSEGSAHAAVNPFEEFPMPRNQRFTVGLTLLNLVLLLAQLSNQASTAFAKQSPLPVLRGRALEIVDDQGRVRANILVHGPETVNGVTYPETVLLRLADPKGGPVVKLTAAANGAALGLSDGLSGNGGVQLYARDTASFVRVVDKAGRTVMLKP
jgi:hypothetical protein